MNSTNIFNKLDHLTHKKLIDFTAAETEKLISTIVYLLREILGNDPEINSFFSMLSIHEHDLLAELSDKELLFLADNVFRFLKGKRDNVRVNLRLTKEQSGKTRQEICQDWMRLTTLYFLTEILIALASQKGTLIPCLEIFAS